MIKSNVIDLSKVVNYDMSELYHWYPNTPEKDLADIGEHYKFLNYISTEIVDQGLILDGGSRIGMSALALGKSKQNIVRGYDLRAVKFPFNHMYPNVSFFCQNLLAEELNIIMNSDLILVDLDPHDGVQERIFYYMLKGMGYKGITIWDDISFADFPGMIEFWNRVDLPKWNVQKAAHKTGTGIIDFGIGLEVIG
jgi:hypothetical protein